MEVAYKINDVDHLFEFRKRVDSDSFPHEIKDINAEFIDSINEKPITMVYFGSEFCQNAMPQERDIDSVINWCNTKGIKLCIYFPPLNDDGISRANSILSIIDGTDVEISVNEIGILELIKEKGYKIVTSLGRTFDKTYRDARFNRYDLDVYCNSEGKRFFQNMPYTSSYYQKFMDSYSVSGVEIDYPLHGKIVTEQKDFGIVSYFPYGVFSTGRTCLFGHFYADRDGKTPYINQCSQYCKKAFIKYIRMQSSIKMDNSGRRIRELNMYKSGNVLYYAVDTGCNNEFYNQLKRLVINYKLV